MFGEIRKNPFEDIFNFPREVDRFNPFRIHTAEDGWRVEIPMPGIDPAHVTLDVAGSTIVVRAEQDGGRNDGATQWEQSLTMPSRLLDLDRIHATHRYGMLTLTIPLRESVKPRRVPIDGVGADTNTQKQLTTA